MIPYKIGQSVISVKLVVEHGPVGGGLDALAAPPQHHGALAHRLAPRLAARAQRPVLQRQRRVVLQHTCYVLL